MSLTKQKKKNIFQTLTKHYGFEKSELAHDFYYSPAHGALLFWDGNYMELTFDLCEKFQRGAILMR